MPRRNKKNIIKTLVITLVIIIILIIIYGFFNAWWIKKYVKEINGENNKLFVDTSVYYLDPDHSGIASIETKYQNTEKSFQDSLMRVSTKKNPYLAKNVKKYYISYVEELINNYRSSQKQNQDFYNQNKEILVYSYLTNIARYLTILKSEEINKESKNNITQANLAYKNNFKLITAPSDSYKDIYELLKQYSNNLNNLAMLTEKSANNQEISQSLISVNNSFSSIDTKMNEILVKNIAPQETKAAQDFDTEIAKIQFLSTQFNKEIENLGKIKYFKLW